MTLTLDLLCFKCKHFFPGGCHAFPEGVDPEVIYENKHDTPLPHQKNNIVFEPIEGIDINNYNDEDAEKADEEI